MDFVSGWPHTSHGSDSSWIIIYWLTKSSYFMDIWIAVSIKRLDHTYVSELVYLHGMPITTILDLGSMFTSSLWRIFQGELGT